MCGDQQEENKQIVPSGPSPVPSKDNKLSFGDSVALVAFVLGVLFVLIIPPLFLKVIGLLAVCAILCWLSRKSHWTHNWSRKWQNTSAVLAILVIWVIAIPQFRAQWRIEHPKPASSQKQPAPSSAKAVEAEKQNVAAEAEAARKAKNTVHSYLAQFPDAPKHTATRVFTLTVLPANTPLKERALLLSEDILEFLVERNENAPPYPKIETWAHDQAIVRAYDAETMKNFEMEFGPNVSSIRDELSLKGLSDPGLDQLYEHPANVHGMRVIAQKIADLAQQLPSPVAAPKAASNPVNNAPAVHALPNVPPPPIELSVSIIGPSAPALVVENQSDSVADGIRWELVMFRISDHAFLSYATQNMGYVKAHSKSAPQIIEPNSLPRAPGGGEIKEGDDLIGSLSVDCALCKGVTLVVSFVWHSSGWFFELPGGNGKLLLTKRPEELSQFIEMLNATIKLEHRKPIL